MLRSKNTLFKEQNIWSYINSDNLSALKADMKLYIAGYEISLATWCINNPDADM